MGLRRYKSPHQKTNEGTYQEEDTSTDKNRVGGREYLPERYKSDNRDRYIMFTKPTPAPRVAENAYRTLIVGLSQFFNLSSPRRVRMTWSTWSWRMVRMAVGESHSWSWVARGWMVRSCSVLFWYACRAFSKLKLEDAVVWDILGIELEAVD